MTFHYLHHLLSNARITVNNYSFNASDGTEREQKRKERNFLRKQKYQYVLANCREISLSKEEFLSIANQTPWPHTEIKIWNIVSCDMLPTYRLVFQCTEVKAVQSNQFVINDKSLAFGSRTVVLCNEILFRFLRVIICWKVPCVFCVLL